MFMPFFEQGEINLIDKIIDGFDWFFSKKNDKNSVE